jgi:hypothetical protein
MLHHAVTGTADLADLADVLGLVARHPAVHPGHLAALAGA